MSTISSPVSIRLAIEGWMKFLGRAPTLTQTDEPLAPYGGLAACGGFLKQLGIIERLADAFPVVLTSPAF